MASSLRCLLVADQLIYQEPLAAMLARQSGFELVGFASCAASAIRACSALLPDLLLLDLALREQDAPVVARAFSVLNPQGRVIVLSSCAGSFRQHGDLRDVIVAIVDRRRGFQELLVAISPLLPAQTCRPPRLDVDQLTARECEVLHQIGTGSCTRAIANRLGIALRTVSTHRQNIAAKLGVSGHALVHQATLLAQNGALSCLKANQPQTVQPPSRV